jgi:hypothetical protein
LQITDLGLSLLRSLDNSSAAPSIVSTPALRTIDELIGTRERLRIFDLELRGLDSGADDGADVQPHQSEPMSANSANEAAAIESPDVSAEPEADDLLETIDPRLPDAAGSNAHQWSPDESHQPPAIKPPEPAAEDAPAFLRRSFGSKALAPSRTSFRQSKPFAFLAAKSRLMSDLWRHHFAQGVSSPETAGSARGVGSAPFALLSLLTLVTCVGAVIALGQIRSLKSDIAVLHRDASYLRERLAKLEQVEKANPPSDRQGDTPRKPEADEKKSGADQAALNLSREEVQLIRDYIKVTPPSLGAASPAVNVGDPVTGGTIALPSAVTDKIPRLLGAQFATRNGAIIISLKNSHRADAVLGAN